MKMNKSILGGLLAGTVLLGAAGVSVASGGDHRMGECDRGTPMACIDAIDNLSEEQRTQLQGLYSERREAMQLQREAMRDNHQALRQAIRDGADAETIKRLAEEQGAQVTAMVLHRAEMQQRMAAILSAEQMQQLQAQRGERRHGGRDDDEGNARR